MNEMQTREDTMSTRDTLSAYSEWLDSQGLILPDNKGDDRPHDDLAQEFITHWESNEHRAVLAGRLVPRLLAGLRDAGQKMLDVFNEAQQ